MLKYCVQAVYKRRINCVEVWRLCAAYNEQCIYLRIKQSLHTFYPLYIRTFTTSKSSLILSASWVVVPALHRPYYNNNYFN